VSGGQVLYTANNPANTTGDLASVPFVRPNPIFERLDFHRQAEAVAGRRMMPSEVSAYWRQQSLEFMAHYPGTFAHMLGHRLLRFWNALEMPDNHSIEIWKRFSWVLRLPLPGYWLIAPFALVGLALMASRRRHLATLYGTLLLYSLSLLPFWISSRYRLPIVGVLILFAAAAMVEIHRRMREGSSQAGTAPAVGLVLACALVWWPVAPPNLPELERNLAYGYEQTGKYEDAIAIYERLRKTESNPLNDLFLANALGHGGRVEEAAAILKRLSEPDQPADLRHQAHNFWGDLARQAQQWPAAERAYREALKIDPTDFGAWNNLGVALAGQQRLTEALQAFEQAVRHAPDDLLSQRNLSEMQRYLAEHPNPRSK
jgi:tetratricopeptide (TPR) repeat protein